MLICMPCFPEFITVNMSFNYSAYLPSSIVCSLLVHKPRDCLVQRAEQTWKEPHQSYIINLYQLRIRLRKQTQELSGFLVLETCSYTQTSFALFNPNLLESAQIMPNRWSCVENSIFLTFLRSQSLFFCLSAAWSLEDLLINRESIFNLWDCVSLAVWEQGTKGFASTRNELGLCPVPVHIHFMPAWTHSLGSWACCKWKMTFLSIGICLGEKHKAFVSIQQLQLWDLWIVLEYTPVAVPKVVLSDLCGSNPQRSETFRICPILHELLGNFYWKEKKIRNFSAFPYVITRG